ncbi:unnamed protein product [Paramecium primaurelia]|uniref:leucine--tRNA ligase n=1 Tax=Paramecium primaurelia TaxID=5886 RepID=A0A8S1PPA6_PARPR|nr:unnamed protein product [Paramecium primaurelia]
MDQKQSFARRDKLRAIEQSIQDQWAANQSFQSNPDERKKFFLTFPFPYANGRLHLGHSFSFSKCDFIARFKRLQGQNVLLPFAFHCTGMPISAAAKRLQRDLDLLQQGKELPKPSQYQSLLQMNIKEEEIPKFADPYHWIRFFPSLGKQDLISFGSSVDWRRSFITTDENPYFNSFIEWHLTKLKEAGYVKFGQRPSIFSTQDGQLCADHDRREGEGVNPQEYTLIKQRVLKPELIDAVLTGKNIFLVCATLRPETMYGQTNTFVLPEGEYGVFEMKNDEFFICSERSALNMAYQGLTKEDKKLNKIATVKGSQLIGMEIKAPLTQYEKVYVLPMPGIKMNKATGVVTSVPSDAPDDWATLRDLQKKPDFYQIKPEWADFKPIPIIDVPKYGDLAALTACDQFQIKSLKDKDLLQKAKEEVYKAGFYEGKMIIGKYKGMKVCDAKPLVRKDMIESGEALPYFEPENTVISRNGDECVVSYCDQWYITYDNQEWKERVKEHVKNNFETYNAKVKQELLDAVDWIREWGLSRSFGLGTKVPWDKQYLIESLSDSTIYFAYYTVAHYLQGDLNGTIPGLAGFTANQMTIPVYDYLFLGKDSEQVPAEMKQQLDIMRKEFLYYYPMNLRSSGKDLIKNHLIFALFNHAAVWKDQPELWPKGYFCNGYILVDGDKMAKSKGNFKTVEDMIKTYGADATRLGCAEAGDLLDDANYELKLADSGILKLTTLEMYIEKIFPVLQNYRTQAQSKNIEFFDNVFESQINYQAIQVIQNYEEMKFRDVAKNGFHVLQGYKDDYLLAVQAEGPNKNLILKYIEIQLTLMNPIVPHITEYCYQKYLYPFVKDQGYPETLTKFVLPNVGTYVYDANILRQYNYLQNLMSTLRVAIAKYKETLKKQKKPEVINKVSLVVAKDFADWQKEVLIYMNRQLIDNEPGFDFNTQIKTNKSKNMAAQLQFSNYIMGEYKQRGADAINPNPTLDEEAFLNNFTQYIITDLKIKEFAIIDSTVAQKSDIKPVQQAGNNAQPGKPCPLFE